MSSRPAYRACRLCAFAAGVLGAQFVFGAYTEGLALENLAEGCIEQPAITTDSSYINFKYVNQCAFEVKISFDIEGPKGERDTRHLSASPCGGHATWQYWKDWRVSNVQTSYVDNGRSCQLAAKIPPDAGSNPADLSKRLATRQESSSGYDVREKHDRIALRNDAANAIRGDWREFFSDQTIMDQDMDRRAAAEQRRRDEENLKQEADRRLRELGEQQQNEPAGPAGFDTSRCTVVKEKLFNGDVYNQCFLDEWGPGKGYSCFQKVWINGRYWEYCQGN
ncbi:hypothetical protein [Rhizobium leguminosarum]|uniref:hypothetical protein n=1 Tax=Rhizobium leguminosarum TaxID=384 RepID=UPI0024B3903B|nr:hypothetical protein [Rhizobium leguminosarum]WHO78792.1 hypothetical protein QMO81_001458 [Rhizobium leguminosarum]